MHLTARRPVLKELHVKKRDQDGAGKRHEHQKQKAAQRDVLHRGCIGSR